MNNNYAFLEFHANEKVTKSLAEASSERRIPANQREPPIFVYLLSLAVAVVTVFLAF